MIEPILYAHSFYKMVNARVLPGDGFVGGKVVPADAGLNLSETWIDGLDVSEEAEPVPAARESGGRA